MKTVVAQYRVAVALALSVIAVGPAVAWNPFGPSNYEDCVVAGMKGQEKFMLSRVEDACELKFPYEREIDLSSLSSFACTWEPRPNGQVAVTIQRNDTIWQIVRIRMIFFDTDCREPATAQTRADSAELLPTRSPIEFVGKTKSDGSFHLICGMAKFIVKRRR